MKFCCAGDIFCPMWTIRHMSTKFIECFWVEWELAHWQPHSTAGCQWISFLSDLSEILYERCAHDAVKNMWVLWRPPQARPYMQLQVHMCRETAWHSDSKEHLDKFCIPRHGLRYLPFGFIKNRSIVQLFLEHKEHKFRNVSSTVQCRGSMQLKTRRANHLICWPSEIVPSRTVISSHLVQIWRVIIDIIVLSSERLE
jgi:hypothetical protein